MDVAGSIQLLDAWTLFDGDTGPERHREMLGRAFLVDRIVPDFSFPFGVFAGFQTETARAGDCRLLEHRPGSCDPPCVAAVCTESGTCVPWLVSASAGTIDFDGGRAALHLPYDDFRGYAWIDPEVAAPAVDECATVTAHAPGDAAPRFELAAIGVGALPPDTIGLALEVSDDADARVTWPAWGSDARVRLRLVSPNRGHGTPSAAIIECDVPDTGELVVPRELIAHLPPSHDDYCAGYDCPASELVRYHRTAIDAAAGRIELAVGSALEFRVVHDPEHAP